jgi:hypothetical protein
MVGNALLLPTLPGYRACCLPTFRRKENGGQRFAFAHPTGLGFDLARYQA